jgi:hypothetical protein
MRQWIPWKIPNMVHTLVGWTQMSPWMSSRNWSGSSCMLRCEGLKIGFPVVAHEVHTHCSEGIWTRASCDQWNWFICNMCYGLDVRVVQSKRWRGYFFKYLFLIHRIVSRRNLYIELKDFQDWKIFLRYIELIQSYYIKVLIQYTCCTTTTLMDMNKLITKSGTS